MELANTEDWGLMLMGGGAWSRVSLSLSLVSVALMLWFPVGLFLADVGAQRLALAAPFDVFAVWLFAALLCAGLAFVTSAVGIARGEGRPALQTLVAAAIAVLIEVPVFLFFVVVGGMN